MPWICKSYPLEGHRRSRRTQRFDVVLLLRPSLLSLPSKHGQKRVEKHLSSFGRGEQRQPLHRWPNPQTWTFKFPRGAALPRPLGCEDIAGVATLGRRRESSSWIESETTPHSDDDGSVFLSKEELPPLSGKKRCVTSFHCRREIALTLEAALDAHHHRHYHHHHLTIYLGFACLGQANRSALHYSSFPEVIPSRGLFPSWLCCMQAGSRGGGGRGRRERGGRASTFEIFRLCLHFPCPWIERRIRRKRSGGGARGKERIPPWEHCSKNPPHTASVSRWAEKACMH